MMCVEVSEVENRQFERYAPRKYRFDPSDTEYQKITQTLSSLLKGRKAEVYIRLYALNGHGYGRVQVWAEVDGIPPAVVEYGLLMTEDQLLYNDDYFLEDILRSKSDILLEWLESRACGEYLRGLNEKEKH